MKKLFLLSVFITSLAYGVPANIIPPVITDTDLQVKVTLNVSTGVYEYQYKIANGATNAGTISSFGFDISTVVPHTSAFESDLLSDQSRLDGEEYAFGLPIPKETVPLGIRAPFEWVSGVGITGEINWGSSGENYDIFPGQNLSGFILQAKAPPGPRKFTIEPFFDDTGFPDDAEGRDDLPQPQDFRFLGTTIGPVLKSELKLFDDKGLPATSDAFLAYSNPAQAPTVLPPGRNKFDLAVYYGNTITPASFTATLINSATVTNLANSTVLTSQFHPTPGGFDVVRLNLQKGENILVLTMAGTRPNGPLGIKEDIALDKLLFIVQ